MHFSKMDAYYHMASQGDPDGFEELYKEFTAKASNLIKIHIRSYQIYTRNPEDFSDIVDKIFFRIINEYDPERGSFSSFVEYIFGVRLAGRVKTMIFELLNLCDGIPQVIDEIVDADAIPDENQTSYQTEIALSSFKLRIATPSSSKTRKERERDRIILLRYAGYNYQEICKIMKIDYNELRYNLELMKNDKEIANLKLELK